jgi:hypothetical protein
LRFGWLEELRRSERKLCKQEALACFGRYRDDLILTQLFQRIFAEVAVELQARCFGRFGVHRAERLRRRSFRILCHGST